MLVKKHFLNYATIERLTKIQYVKPQKYMSRRSFSSRWLHLKILNSTLPTDLLSLRLHIEHFFFLQAS